MRNRTIPELLAIMLSTSPDDHTAAEAADALMSEHDGLRGLFRAASRVSGHPETAASKTGLLKLAAAAELCRRRLFEKLSSSAALTSPAETIDYLQSALVDLGNEVFLVLFLDTRHRVIRVEQLFQGSIDGACVYPRVVAERALLLGAAAIIVAHNHPSGIAEPSLADQAITRRLRDALALLEIRLLDHFIVGEGSPVSLANRGLL
jgi:DNA repair protein RadC